jgi:2,3-dimethylmalate lyase
MSSLHPGAIARARLADGEALVAPCVYDAVGARLVKECGFDCVYLSGFAVSASMGLPDVGLTTLTEVARRAARIAEAADPLPVLCDVDTGFGDFLQIRRMVREFEQAGVAGVKLEDQVTPANRVGRPVVPVPEMIAKLDAAIGARRSDDFLVMARTDSAPTLGLDEAIARCRAFREAGADVTHALDVPTVEEMRELVESVEGPSVGVISLPHPPVLSVGELKDIGFKLIILSVPVQFSAVKAMYDFLCGLGDDEAADSTAVGVSLDELVGISTTRGMEIRHLEDHGLSTRTA